MLSDIQRRFIAETLSNIGVIFFSSTLVTPFFTSKVAIDVALAGVASALTAWLLGLIIIKDINS